MSHKFAYNAPDEFRPKEGLDLTKIASKPFMGLTAFVASRPHLVVGFDGAEYSLEDTRGDVISLSSFDWDVDNYSEENALIAASRIEGSPLEIGREIDGQTIGKLAYDGNTGEWSVKDTTGGDVDLLNLIEQLEAAGWEVEETDSVEIPQELSPTIERAASASCTECKDEDCDSTSCQCPCHEKKEAADVHPDDDPDLESAGENVWAPTPRGKYSEDPELAAGGVEGRGVFSGNCDSCGRPYGEHSIEGMRCPQKGDIRNEDFSAPTPPTEVGEVDERKSSFDKTTDTNGDSLRAGEFYEMHSKNYKIPDTIKIIQITPELLVATTHEGSVTLKIKPEEIETEGYSFEPLFPMSDPDLKMESHFIETLEKTARRKFSPGEQRALIDEMGVARNRDKLRLEDSHYFSSDDAESEEEDFDVYFL